MLCNLIKDLLGSSARDKAYIPHESILWCDAPDKRRNTHLDGLVLHRSPIWFGFTPNGHKPQISQMKAKYGQVRLPNKAK